MHARTQIRNALATLLTGLATTGANVFTSRVTDYDREHELPALNIMINEEDHDRGEEAAEMGSVEWRQIEIVIEGRIAAAGTDNIDDDLDQLALEVELAIAGDADLGGLLFDFEYAGTSLELDDEAETVTGLITISYAASYRIDASDPETIIT